jgi:hypothetical protein
MGAEQIYHFDDKLVASESLQPVERFRVQRGYLVDWSFLCLLSLGRLLFEIEIEPHLQTTKIHVSGRASQIIQFRRQEVVRPNNSAVSRNVQMAGVSGWTQRASICVDRCAPRLPGISGVQGRNSLIATCDFPAENQATDRCFDDKRS